VGEDVSALPATIDSNCCQQHTFDRLSHVAVDNKFIGHFVFNCALASVRTSLLFLTRADMSLQLT
jgi:hypothetical protein